MDLINALSSFVDETHSKAHDLSHRLKKFQLSCSDYEEGIDADINLVLAISLLCRCLRMSSLYFELPESGDGKD